MILSLSVIPLHIPHSLKIPCLETEACHLLYMPSYLKPLFITVLHFPDPLSPNSSLVVSAYLRKEHSFLFRYRKSDLWQYQFEQSVKQNNSLKHNLDIIGCVNKNLSQANTFVTYKKNIVFVFVRSMDSYSVTILQGRFNKDSKFLQGRIMGGLYFTYLRLPVWHPIYAVSFFTQREWIDT